MAYKGKSIFVFKNGPMFISVFTNKQYNDNNKSMWKNVHPVYGARIQTFRIWVVTHNH